MTINTDESNLIAEIHASERRRDQHLESLQDEIERYHGPWYKGGGPEDEERVNPENHAYEYISAFIGQVLHDRPRVKVSTARPTAQKHVAEALQSGVNRWVVDTNFKSTLEEMAYDYMFRWCMGLTSVGPRADAYELSDPFLMPQVQRISPYDGGWDSMATNPKRARFFFHRWSIDKDDLIRMAQADGDLPEEEQQGWNIEGVRKLLTGEPSEIEHIDNDHAVERDRVWLYDIWIADDQVDPDKGPDQGFHGTLRTIAATKTEGAPTEGAIIRDPIDYLGPATGPYRVGGCYLVPDKNEPLSPLVATQLQADNLNSFAHTVISDILDYKKVTFLAGEDLASANRINEAKHGSITLLESAGDLQNNMQTSESGGASQHHFAGLEYFRSLLERVSGFTDVQKGNITGDGTATEVGFAVEASAGRTEYIRSKFVQFAEGLLTNVSYFFYHVDQIIFPLGEEGLAAVQAGQDEPLPEAAEAWFFGGDFDEGSGGTFQDLELSIELFSMARTSEAALRRKSEVVMNILVNAYPVLVAPGVRGQLVMDLLADLENMQELSTLIDFDEIGKTPTGSANPMLARLAGTAIQGGGLPSPDAGQGQPGQDIAAAQGAAAGLTGGAIQNPAGVL